MPQRRKRKQSRRRAVRQARRRRRTPGVLARRRYRRNPPIRGRQVGGFLSQAMQTAGDSLAVMVGGAASRTVANLIPGFNDPVGRFAKGVLVAALIRGVGGRLVGVDVARFAAAGALAAPLRDAITNFVPGAATFLGRSDDVMVFPAPVRAASLGAYSSAYGNGALAGLGAYSTGPAYSSTGAGW